MKKIIITGITGQDGSYMAEYCLNLGHTVYGMVRRTAQIHDTNYRHLLTNSKFNVIRGDLSDSSSLDEMVKQVQPDYFINFAAQSFVGDSWKIPEETFMAGAVGVLKCLEAVRKYAPLCRFYNAGSSEQFGDVIYTPQDEKHPFRPRSPYGAAKCSADHLVKVYRESYGLYAVQGLLFNHESERRGIEFVTRKITKGVARISNYLKFNQDFDPIELGNLSAKRDWSHAEDFMDGVWRMLNQEEYRPELKQIADNLDNTHNSWTKDVVPRVKGYVLSSNETHTIREFIEKAFAAAGVEIENTNPDEVAPAFDMPHAHQVNYQTTSGFPVVVVNPKYYRPNEVDLLLGDSTLARKELGWEPKISFDKLVKRMVESDLYGSGSKT